MVIGFSLAASCRWKYNLQLPRSGKQVKDEAAGFSEFARTQARENSAPDNKTTPPDSRTLYRVAFVVNPNFAEKDLIGPGIETSKSRTVRSNYHFCHERSPGL
jgi:hypothetical protein